MRIPHDPQFAWSVQEVNQGVRTLIAEGFDQPIWVQGELGRIQFAARNSVYSTLKDPDGTAISIVYFGGANEFTRLHLGTGSTVMLLAQLDTYVRNGTYQLKVIKVMPASQQGMLMQRYLETRDRLAAEGLFDPSRKKPLPALPRCIAVLTSPHGAAVHDFINTALARVPGLHIRVIGVKVQGEGAARDVLQALDFLNRNADSCDVIVITRGGGSMEDLWEFNDEALSRGIAASRIPVVSAVGHQIDHTICDFVADCSVITPTEAAIKVTEFAYNASQAIQEMTRRLENAQRLRISYYRNHLTRLKGCPMLTRPDNLYTQQTMRLQRAMASLSAQLPQKTAASRTRLAVVLPRLAPLLAQQLEHCRHGVADATRRLPGAIAARLSREKATLLRLQSLLEAYSPRGVLTRGYSILLDEEKGTAIRSPEGLSSGHELKALLAHGELTVVVK